MPLPCPVPVIGLAARSGSGKTTLLKKLIGLSREAGWRCSAIKKSHHDFEVDIPGKDSYEIRHAGVEQMLLASPYRQALITEKRTRQDPALDSLLQQLDTDYIDFIFVEGFRSEPIPKIEISRAMLGDPVLYLTDPHIIAVAADTEVTLEKSLPLLDLNDADAIWQFILAKLQLAPAPPN